MSLRPAALSIRILALILAAGALPLSGSDLTHHPDGSPVAVKLQTVLSELQDVDGAQQNDTADLADIARWAD